MKHVVAGMRYKDICTSGGAPLELEQDLFDYSFEVLENLQKADTDAEVILGMSYGFEFLIAEVCIQLRIPFTAAIAFPEFEKLWPQSVKIRYRSIIAAAKEVRYTSDKKVSHHKAGQFAAIAAYRIRNDWMLDQLSPLGDMTRVRVLWNKDQKGSTWGLVRLAAAKEIRMLNLWDEWEDFKKIPILNEAGCTP